MLLILFLPNISHHKKTWNIKKMPVVRNWKNVNFCSASAGTEMLQRERSSHMTLKPELSKRAIVFLFDSSLCKQEVANQLQFWEKQSIKLLQKSKYEKQRASDLTMKFLQSIDSDWEHAWDTHISILLSGITSFIDPQTGTIEDCTQWLYAQK